MRIFRRTWKRNGKVHRADTWSLRQRRGGGEVCFSTGLRDRRTAEQCAAQIERLQSYRATSERPPADLVKWLGRLPARLQEQLLKYELVDPHWVTAGKPVSEHLEAWKAKMRHDARTALHIRRMARYVQLVVEDLEIIFTDELEVERVKGYLADLRNRTEQPLSVSATNHYVRALRAFGRWLERSGHHDHNPLAGLTEQSIRGKEQHARRALSTDEWRHLLASTWNQPRRYGLTGEERYWLYLLASRTGLRANEIRTTTVGRYQLEGKAPAVTVISAYAKNRRGRSRPLTPELAAGLRDLFRGRLPGAQAFRVTDKTSKMLRADLAAAEIPYADDAGRVYDFHALRKQFGTDLARAGVPMHVVMREMDHSTVTLTADVYTHVLASDSLSAVRALPESLADRAERCTPDCTPVCSREVVG